MAIRSAVPVSSMLIVAALVLAAGCPQADDVPDARRDPVVQGVSGLVLFWKGNHMPGSPDGTKTPVIREILIHQATTAADAVSQGGGFYSAVSTPRVATVRSGADGRFEVALPVGRYSLFVRERDMFYATLGDIDGTLFPVEVVADSVTDVAVDITYEASF